VNIRKSKQPAWKTKLAALNAFARTGVKSAGLGGRGDDVAFEQAFSNLAHSYLQDKAPGLLEHEIGFQMLDRNSENTKAVGVFGFKVGDLWLYAPMFFLKGDLKGHELLYLKDQDMFVPLKENWVNYLVNRKPTGIGGGVSKDTARLGGREPDFSQLSRSPAKFAAVDTTLKDMVDAVLPSLAKMATANTAKTFAELGDALNLATFLKQAGLQTISALVDACQRAPDLAAAFDEFHGLAVIKEAIDLAHARGRAALTKAGSVLSDAPDKPKAMSTLRVICHDLTIQTAPPHDITEEEQEKLLEDGVLISDKRDRDNVSVAYNVQSTKKFFNPSESGLYDILVKPSELERVYVAIHPQGPGARADFATIVCLDGARDWVNVSASSVFAMARVEGDEFTEWFDKLPDADKLPNKSEYMAINANGDSTVPFCKLTEYGSNEFGTTSYEIRPDTYGGDGVGRSCCRNSTDTLAYNSWRDGARIHLNGKRGSKLRASGGDIFVPAGFKLLRVGANDYASSGGLGLMSWSACEKPQERPEFRLGTLLDVQNMLMNKTASLEVRHNGTEVELYTSSVAQQRSAREINLTEKSAVISLVANHGLREVAAREIIKQAASLRKFNCRIKYAGPYGPPMMIEDGPSAPAMPEPVMGGESIMNSSVPTQLGIDQAIQVPDMSAAKTDRSVYNPNTKYDKSQMGDPELQRVMDAAGSGQREVFDTAMIGGMLRAVREDGLVDRYMSDLTKGLDKLGRILFMFYWHGDKFAERYGKSDMPELEDSLRNAFEMLGDVILFLKQKEISADPYNMSQNVDLSAVANS